MEIQVLEKTKDTIRVRIQGGTQAIIPLIMDAAKEKEGVFVGQVLDHPLKHAQILIVKVNKGNAEDVLKELIDSALEKLDDAKKAIDQLNL